jgi:hypothetical protein
MTIINSIKFTPLSPEMRGLLLDFTACDLQKPLRRVAVDWSQVLHYLQCHRLIGYAYYYLSHQVDPDYPPPAFQQAVRKLHYFNVARMAKIYRHFRGAANQLQQHNIDFLVLKGPALAYLVSPEPAIRYFNDLDLMVRERHWSEVNTALELAGYMNLEGFPSPPPKIMPQAIHHETKYFHNQSDFVIDIHYEDLLHDNLAARDIDGFWSRAVSIPIEGLVIKALSLEDQLLHLCGHAHKHGYTHLYLLADLLFILRDHASQLDWAAFLRTVALEEAQVPVYYSLRLVAHLFDVSPPAGVLQAVRPDAFRRWWHERYMPVKFINSLSLQSWNNFSFKERPLFSSAILNLLVMGRRAEKLRYVLHLLFPPPQWLRHAYGLPPNRILAPYYLLRPFRLAFHTLGDIILAIFSRLKPRP